MALLQDARKAHETRQSLKLVAPLRIVWPTGVDCNRALSDFTAYHLSHGLGLLDSLIAACAIGQSATLYTFNAKHYQVVRIQSLTGLQQLSAWYSALRAETVTHSVRTIQRPGIRAGTWYTCFLKEMRDARDM